jgi:CRP-like cAMP-binding protein
VHRQDLIPFLKKRPEISISWLAILCERLRRSEKLVQETVFLGVEARLARQLIGLAKAYGRKQGKRIFLDVKLTQRDLANLVGMTRESINKQLCKWRRQGVIAFRGKQYTILDFGYLKQEIKKTS